MSAFDHSDVVDRLAATPRHRLGHLPTPLERLDRLTAERGGPEIWITRDDCTGLALGGNKTRKIEYLLAAAQAEESAWPNSSRPASARSATSAP